ncbi:MAG: ferrous iron transport protein A [Chthoniobacterales bacterium]|jgi:ferrous iron transport protein A|nr:ferrous iron transport protein A [Chthoniobacterales bacterium]
MSKGICSLSALRTGERGRVCPGSPDHPALQRLLAMGLLPGTIVRLVQTAPLGDPVEIEFNGTRLSLRKADAAAVEVERAD